MGVIKKIFCNLLNIFFNWRIIAVQYSIGFCHRTRQISHNYTFITSLLSLPPFPSSHPSRSSEGTSWASVLHTNFSLAICFTHGSIYMSIPLPPFAPFFLPLLFCSQETVYPPRKVKEVIFIFFWK